MPENTRKNSDQNSMAWSWYPWIILRVQIESCNLATHPTNSAEPPSNLNHLPTFKKKHPKAKMSSLPYKKKTLKKKLPPSYYTHLVLIGISASRLLVVFLQPLWRPVERQGLSSMTSKSIQHCWSCPLLAHAAMVAVPLEVLGRERFFDGKLAWYLEIFV